MFRAFDPAAERLVAVKLFRLDLPPERVHQFVAELERLIAAGLAHPAIASPLAAGIVGVEAYLAAEFVAADSLDIIIRDNGPAPVGHAIQVAAQLAGAIDYAAAVGISHGALHPRDVLVSSDDTRITGFGIAQALERVGVSAPVRRPYTAPERIDNQKWGREADVFALAAISHELLTGRRIAGPGTDAVTGLADVPGVDVELARAVFARALAADPSLRFETALQFVDALKQSIDETVAAQSIPENDAKRPRRRVEEEPRLPLEEAQPAPAAEPVAHAPVPVIEPAMPATASTFDPAELDLASTETERYRDVESAPAVVPEPSVPDLPLVTTAAPLPPLDRSMALDTLPIDERVDAVAAPRPSAPGSREPVRVDGSALDRSRSAMWPLILALVVGIAIGFATGYGVGTRAVSSGTPAGASQDADEAGRTLPSAQTVPPIAPLSDSAAVAAEQALAASPRPANAPAPQQSAPAPQQSAPASAQAVNTPPSAPAQAVNTPPPAQVAPSTKPAPSRAAAAEEPAATGRILVRSTPAGARVYVDGRDRGETPIAIRDLPPGTHHVRVVRDGYTTVERRVLITARRPAQSLQVALGRAASREASTRAAAETFVGALAVESRPSGAKVYLDGRLVGTTPMEVPGVTAGSHVVRLEHDGYRRWSSAVRVVSGERNRVTASLEK